ncbi:MAG: Mur ligase domain-containing protein [Planctomycetaceae bacterium]
MPAWTLIDVIDATAGQPVGIVDRAARFARVQTDSRKLKPGELFWAIPGERYDGHNFVSEALRQGAIAAIVAHDWGAIAGQREWAVDRRRGNSPGRYGTSPAGIASGRTRSSSG